MFSVQLHRKNCHDSRNVIGFRWSHSLPVIPWQSIFEVTWQSPFDILWIVCLHKSSALPCQVRNSLYLLQLGWTVQGLSDIHPVTKSPKIGSHYCFSNVPGSAPGCRTGNREKLSSTQAEPVQAIKSGVAYFPSISCMISWRRSRYQIPCYYSIIISLWQLSACDYFLAVSRGSHNIW